jgi:hypothetical protein
MDWWLLQQHWVASRTATVAPHQRERLSRWLLTAQRQESSTTDLPPSAKTNPEREEDYVKVENAAHLQHTQVIG